MIPVIFGIGIIVRDIDISHRREAGENAVIASVPVGGGVAAVFEELPSRLGIEKCVDIICELAGK